MQACQLPSSRSQGKSPPPPSRKHLKNSPFTHHDSLTSLSFSTLFHVVIMSMPKIGLDTRNSTLSGTITGLNTVEGGRRFILARLCHQPHMLV